MAKAKGLAFMYKSLSRPGFLFFSTVHHSLVLSAVMVRRRRKKIPNRTLQGDDWSWANADG